MERTQKVDAIKDLEGRFARMTSAVFVDFTGVNVEEVTKLRNTFRDKGVDYRVVKNKLVFKALEQHAWAKGLKPVLKGMTGVAWCYDEPSAAARVLKEFCKGNEKLKIKAGLLEGQILGAKAVEEQLATLPSKDEARSMLLATLNAPAQRFVMLLNAPGRNFVGVLAAKQRQDGG